MASNKGEGDGTARTRQLADERDGHQQTGGYFEGEDTTLLLDCIEALERAMRVGHSSPTHDTPSITNSGHGRQLIMTITKVKGHIMM